MKTIKLLLALAPLALALPARAQHNAGKYEQFTPTTSGSVCATGNVCLWYDSGSQSFQAKNPAGGSFPVISGTAYTVVEQGGTPLTQESVINFLGSGVSCVDNAGAHRTDCTISGGGGGGGSLQAAYLASTGAPVIITESVGNGGVIYTSPMTPIGTILGVATGSGNTVANFPDNAAISFQSQQSAGLIPSYIFTTATDMTTGGNTVQARFRNAGQNWISLLGVSGFAYISVADPATGVNLGAWLQSTTSPHVQITTQAIDGPDVYFQHFTANTITNVGAHIDETSNNGTALSYLSPNGDLHLPASGTIFGIDNVLVASHVLLDANTARLVAQNAVVNASNASGTLITYTPWTIGVEFISDGVDFYNSGVGDIMILDNTGAVSTFALSPGLTGANAFQVGKFATPISALYNSGPLSGGYNTQAGAAYTALFSDYYIGLSNVAARTVTLCAASDFRPGQMLIVNDEAGTALAANITINRAGADTIDGATSKVINTNNGDLVLISDGVSKWFVVARGL